MPPHASAAASFSDRATDVQPRSSDTSIPLFFLPPLRLSVHYLPVSFKSVDANALARTLLRSTVTERSHSTDRVSNDGTEFRAANALHPTDVPTILTLASFTADRCRDIVPRKSNLVSRDSPFRNRFSAAINWRQ